MKKIKSGILFYLIALSILFMLALPYTYYIYKTGNKENKIIEIIIGIIFFLVLGFLFGNNVHKKGILVGLFVGIINIILIIIFNLILNKTFIFNPISYSIYLLACIAAAIFGTNFKKIL